MRTYQNQTDPSQSHGTCYTEATQITPDEVDIAPRIHKLSQPSIAWAQGRECPL